MNKKIKKQLDNLIEKELKFQNIKDLKEEYDEEWQVSCGIVIGLSRAIKLMNENKKFNENLKNILIKNAIG